MAHSVCGSAQDYCHSMTSLFGALDNTAIESYADLLFDAWRENRCVFVFGNGGSAFTAGHHALDYIKTAAVPNQHWLKAISLVDNIGMTTALGNDLTFDETFVYPLRALAAPGDIAVAISCSGNSPNVVKASAWAKDNGMIVVALTGFDGGRLAHLADIHIHIPSDNYGVVEDIQMSIGHIAAQLLHQRVLATVVPA